MKHGGSGTAYSHYGCRCEECKKSNRDRAARRRAERTLETKDPNDPRHGTPAFYSNHGCRCVACTEASKAACAQRRERREAS